MAKKVVKGRNVVVVAAGSVVPMVARYGHGAPRSLTCFVSWYVLEPLDLVAMDTPGSLDVMAKEVVQGRHVVRVRLGSSRWWRGTATAPPMVADRRPGRRGVGRWPVNRRRSPFLALETLSLDAWALGVGNGL